MSNAPANLTLRHARIVTPSAIVEGDVTIASGVISAVGGHGPAAGGRLLDLDGLTLFPGFIDIHIHGALGVDTNVADAAGLDRIGQFLLTHGVTAWLPTLVPAASDEYEHAMQAIRTVLARQSSPCGARVLGVHYEGPFVNAEQCGALHSEHFRQFSSPWQLESLPTIPSGSAIHMMTIAPEVAGGIDLIRELKKRNWVISIGHTRADVPTLEQARAAGAAHMTHFMNAMTPLHHRTIGAVGWGLLRDDVTCDVIADGIHVDREVLHLIVRNKGVENVSLISDGIAAAGLGDGNYNIWGETINVTNNRTRNAQGAIAGSVITMLDATRLMLQLGYRETDIAQMASMNPARLLRLDGRYGSIETGKQADLVAIDGDGNVRFTILSGEIAFQS